MDAKDVLLASVLTGGSGGGGGGGSGGGNNALIVRLSGTPANFTIDKTYNEIAEAVSNGRYVMLTNEFGNLVANLNSIDGDECLFTSCFAAATSIEVLTFAVNQDNTVSVHPASVLL